MERHTPYARGPHGPITQTDGRFWAVHCVLVGFMVAPGVWLLRREQSQRSTTSHRRPGARHLLSGIRLKEPC